MPYGIAYAGAESDYEDADVFLFGIPYDRTACFRAGAREAPAAIRRASYNFEESHFEHGLHQRRLGVFDYGDCDDFVLPEDMLSEVGFAVAPAVRDGKFVVGMGGEHSVNIPIVRAFPERGVALLSIDAHLDSRDEYLGTPYSHACVTRRAAEHLGLDNVFVIGARSIAEEELDRDDPVPFVSSFEVMETGIEKAVGRALDSLKAEKVYLTLDIDGVDPAYAPGTGTPEPFGLTPMDVKKAVGLVGDRLAGFDVNEVCPPADPSGITSVLAARMINEVLAVHAKSLGRRVRPCRKRSGGPRGSVRTRGRPPRFQPRDRILLALFSSATVSEQLFAVSAAFSIASARRATMTHVLMSMSGLENADLVTA